MVASSAYPSLERKLGGPDNWVERAGGLPSYIERIAKHLHYEKGYAIGRAIATAVNTVRRWAVGGTVTKSGTTKRITPKTMALAAAAVASWEAKKKAGKINLTMQEFFVIDLTEVSEDEAYDLLDLADADVSPENGMVALMHSSEVAAKIAVEGGVPADDMHVTITFHPDLSGDKFQRLVDDLKAWAQDAPMDGTLKGTIGGIGAFPAGDNGVPWFVPVDVPGLNTLHEQVRAVADRSAPASESHGYSPHTTLTYAKEGEAGPSPVPSTPVTFTSMWVVRGNDEKVEIPLNGQAGADLTERAILSAGNFATAEGDMDIRALAERANQVADPTQRAAARRAVLDLANPTVEIEDVLTNVVIDLASTIAPRNARGKATDGRNSFKGQGKWKHGFIPANAAAKEAKAKGSPIAMKRMRRLFGKDKVADDARKPSRGAKSAGVSKNQGFRKQDADTIKIKERGQSERASSVAALRNTEFQDVKETKHSNPSNRMEASKESRVPNRARQPWGDIPANLKTMRNGKRYVLATFGGKQIITEWIGGVNEADSTPLAKRKVMRSITSADAANMPASELRNMLKNPRTPAGIRKALNKALRDKETKEHRRA